MALKKLIPALALLAMRESVIILVSLAICSVMLVPNAWVKREFSLFIEFFGLFEELDDIS